MKNVLTVGSLKQSSWLSRETVKAGSDTFTSEGGSQSNE